MVDCAADQQQAISKNQNSENSNKHSKYAYRVLTNSIIRGKIFVFHTVDTANYKVSGCIEIEIFALITQ
jgi:hypothetical protein